MLLDFCVVTNQGGWTKEVRTNWSLKKGFWYRLGTDHAILSLRGTAEVPTRIHRADTILIWRIVSGIIFLFLEGFGPCGMNLAWQGQTEDASADMMQIWRWYGWSQLLHEDNTGSFALFSAKVTTPANSYRIPVNLQSALQLSNFRSKGLNMDRQKQVLLGYIWQDCTRPEKEKTFQEWTKSSAIQTIGTSRAFSFIRNTWISTGIVRLNKLLPHLKLTRIPGTKSQSYSRLSPDLWAIIEHVMMYSYPISS
jgi:hypothetical protein